MDNKTKLTEFLDNEILVENALSHCIRLIDKNHILKHIQKALKEDKIENIEVDSVFDGTIYTYLDSSELNFMFSYSIIIDDSYPIQRIITNDVIITNGKVKVCSKLVIIRQDTNYYMDIIDSYYYDKGYLNEYARDLYLEQILDSKIIYKNDFDLNKYVPKLKYKIRMFNSNSPESLLALGKSNLQFSLRSNPIELLSDIAYVITSEVLRKNKEFKDCRIMNNNSIDSDITRGGSYSDWFSIETNVPKNETYISSKINLLSEIENELLSMKTKWKSINDTYLSKSLQYLINNSSNIIDICTKNYFSNREKLGELQDAERILEIREILVNETEMVKASPIYKLCYSMSTYLTNVYRDEGNEESEDNKYYLIDRLSRLSKNFICIMEDFDKMEELLPDLNI